MESSDTITSQSRLRYLIDKYFKTQKEFADKAQVHLSIVTEFLNYKTKKISNKNLMKIEANVGFSTKYILHGIGDEIVKGYQLIPVIESANPVALPSNIESKSDKARGKNLNRGESMKMTLATSVKNTKLTDHAVSNVVDAVFDELGKPMQVQIADIGFSSKYELKIGSIIIIDEGNYQDGDIVLLQYKRRHYLCEYIKNVDGESLLDTDLNLATREDINIADAEIIGAVYSEIRKF